MVIEEIREALIKEEKIKVLKSNNTMKRKLHEFVREDDICKCVIGEG